MNIAVKNTLKLYEISNEYLLALDALTERDDLPPEAITDTLDGIIGTFHDKATAVAAYICNLEAEAEAVETARKRMETRQRGLQRQADRLRHYLKLEMERTGFLKFRNCELTLRVQKNPPSTIVDDESQIPDQFKETLVTVKLLKADIGKALKAGAHIPGARLEQTTRLVIA